MNPKFTRLSSNLVKAVRLLKSFRWTNEPERAGLGVRFLSDQSADR